MERDLLPHQQPPEQVDHMLHRIQSSQHRRSVPIMDYSSQSNEESQEIDRLRRKVADAECTNLKELEALRTALEQLERQFSARTAELEQNNEALITEIAERKRVEVALKESEERLRRMVNAVTAYTYSVEVRDGQAVETTHSMGCFPVTGYMPDDYKENPYLWHDMIHEDDRRMVEKEIGKLLSGQDVPSIEHRLIRRDGKVVWVRNTMVPHRDETGQVIRYDGLIEDIAKRKNIEEELRAASILDDLTGLNNRRGFLALAQQQFKIATRLRRPLLLFFIDLDGMKWINDNCGHAEGDMALMRTALVLKASFRESDIIGRMGGDEFAVLTFESENDEGSAERINIRIQNNIDAENLRQPSKYTLSLSIGTSRFDPACNAALEDLLAEADAVMYDQKQRRKELRES
jgi:diguanylate cyclase (GGDEF)-like protein/PAS domain S-box-containing protein